MNSCDKQLLSNLFDSLDRLFDGESRVIDVWQLMLATEKAISSELGLLDLNNYSVQLGKIVRAGKAEGAQKEDALAVTNKLREVLNEILYS